MAWAAVNNNIIPEIIILYMSAIFWTLGYDTIYGTQDMSDDEIIGLKSTAIKFKKNIKFFVFFSYLISALLMLYLFKNYMGINIFTFLLILFFSTLIFQVIKFNKHNPKACLNMFKLNSYSGLFLFLGILSINL